MNWWSSMSLKRKITSALVLIMILVGVTTARTWMISSKLATRATVAHAHLNHLRDSARITGLADELKLHTVQVQQWLQDIASTRGLDGLNDGFDEAESHAKLFRARAAELRNLLVQLEMQEDVQTVDKMVSRFEAYYKVGVRMAQAYINDGPAGGNPMMPEFDEQAEQLGTISGELITRQRKANEHLEEMLETEFDAIDAHSAQTRVLAEIGFFMVTASCIALIVAIRIWLFAPLLQLIERLRDMAQGEADLTRRLEIHRDDEIGQMSSLFNQMMEKLATVMRDVSGTALEVASASTQIAASSEELAHGMQDQERQTALVSSAAEQMSASVSEVAHKAKDAADVAAEGGQQAVQGGEIVSRAVSGMEVINDEVSESARAVGELGKRGEQIGQVISVINDIADQTNLLALNAAIEAARAGEHGRGFAVVADEVRKLAERTTRATEEVTESIKAIQQETNNAVNRMESGTTRVNEGVGLAHEAGQALESIVGGSKNIATMIHSIAAAAEQQNIASVDICRNVESINAVTQESAQAVSQVAAATNQLSEKAEQLQRLVGRFRLNSDN